MTSRDEALALLREARSTLNELAGTSISRRQWARETVDKIDKALLAASDSPADKPVGWIATKGDRVIPYSVADGWQVHEVATLPASEGEQYEQVEPCGKRAERDLGITTAPPAPATPSDAPTKQTDAYEAEYRAWLKYAEQYGHIAGAMDQCPLEDDPIGMMRKYERQRDALQAKLAARRPYSDKLAGEVIAGQVKEIDRLHAALKAARILGECK